MTEEIRTDNTDVNTWTLIYRGYHVHCIEAWCELPTFDKE